MPKSVSGARKKASTRKSLTERETAKKAAKKITPVKSAAKKTVTKSPAGAKSKSSASKETTKSVKKLKKNVKPVLAKKTTLPKKAAAKVKKNVVKPAVKKSAVKKAAGKAVVKKTLVKAAPKKISAQASAEIKKLMAAKTPEQYIDICLKTKLDRSEKGLVTREWLEKTGFGIKDIEHARNRHPYWKKLKSKNHDERSARRMKRYDYTPKSKKNISPSWDKKELREFLKLNEKLADWQLAERFETSIPAVNHIRRKINMSKKILAAKNLPVGATIMLAYVTRAESILSEELKTLSGAKKNKKR